MVVAGHIHILGRAVILGGGCPAVLVAAAQTTHLIVQEAVELLVKVMLVDQQAHLLPHTQVRGEVGAVRVEVRLLGAFPEMAALVLPTASLEHPLIMLVVAVAVHLVAAQLQEPLARVAAVTAAQPVLRRRAVAGPPTRVVGAVLRQVGLWAVVAGLVLLLLEQQPHLHQQQALRP